MCIMNVNLGAPYEAAIKAIIEKGYAETQTEVIRQAILAYERMIGEDEQSMVHKAVNIEMTELNAGGDKTHSFQEIKKSVASGREIFSSFTALEGIREYERWYNSYK